MVNAVFENHAPDLMLSWKDATFSFEIDEDIWNPLYSKLVDRYRRAPGSPSGRWRRIAKNFKAMLLGFQKHMSLSQSNSMRTADGIYLLDESSRGAVQFQTVDGKLHSGYLVEFEYAPSSANDQSRATLLLDDGTQQTFQTSSIRLDTVRKLPFVVLSKEKPTFEVLVDAFGRNVEVGFEYKNGSKTEHFNGSIHDIVTDGAGRMRLKLGPKNGGHDLFVPLSAIEGHTVHAGTSIAGQTVRQAPSIAAHAKQAGIDYLVPIPLKF